MNCQTTQLSEKQREKISQHPQRSVQMLQASGLETKEWLEVLLQHHERDDCSGYPFGADSQVIHSYLKKPNLDIRKLSSAESAAALNLTRLSKT